MPFIASGANATFNVAATNSISVQCPGGFVQLEFPVGTKLFEGNVGTGRTFGPFAAGSAKLTSLQSGIFFEVVLREAQNTPFDPANVVVTSLTASGPVRGALVNTAAATVGGAILTAASLVGGVITRTGSTAPFTDTTESATALIAAIPSAQVGTAFDLTIVNTVAFAQSLAPGAGVTLAGTTTLAASSTRRFIGTVTSLTTPAVTITGISAGTL